jgi:hypothetical protein
VNLSQVVLPAGHLESVLAHCKAYDSYIQYISKSSAPFRSQRRGDEDTAGMEDDIDIEEAAVRSRAASFAAGNSTLTSVAGVSPGIDRAKKVAYGNGLVVLLCGKSGSSVWFQKQLCCGLP